MECTNIKVLKIKECINLPNLKFTNVKYIGNVIIHSVPKI